MNGRNSELQVNRLHSCCNRGEQVGHTNGKPGNNEHNSSHVPTTDSTQKESVDSPQVTGKGPVSSQVNVWSCYENRWLILWDY